MKQWVNRKYLVAYNDGSLYEKYCERSPFKHAVLSNFFNREIISRIEESCADIKLVPSHGEGIAKDTSWNWGPFSDINFLKFYYGKEFRNFLNTLLQEKLKPKTAHYPQYNVFMPNSKGLAIHNDVNENIAATSILYLTKSTGEGGELILHKRINNMFQEFKKIKSQSNTLVLFMVNDESYHSTADMHGDWQRQSITIDWCHEGIQYE